MVCQPYDCFIIAFIALKQIIFTCSDHKLTREYVLRTITSESRDTLEKLNTIWLELGIKDDQRQTRNETVISLITSKISCGLEPVFTAISLQQPMLERKQYTSCLSRFS